MVNVRQFFLNYSTAQFDEAVRLLSPDVVYTVPGDSQISGVYRGREEVRRHMAKLIELSRGTFEVLKWMDWMVGETHIAALQYAQAQGHGDIYRGHHLYLVESDANDLLSTIRVFFENPEEADRFFSWGYTS